MMMQVCEHFASESMDLDSMSNWFSARIETSVSETTRIAKDIQRAWRGNRGRVRFERFREFIAVLKRLEKQDKEKREAATNELRNFREKLDSGGATSPERRASISRRRSARPRSA